jgi:hypothetical protein
LCAAAAPVARGQGTEQVVYDNLSTLSALGPNYLFDVPNDFSIVSGKNIVTSLVADDLIFKVNNTTPVLAQPLRITKVAFYVTNRNTTAVTVRPLLRMWNDDAGGLGGGTDEPGTLLRKMSLAPITLAAAPSGGFSSTLVTVDLTGGNPFGGMNVPGSKDANGNPIAGDPYRIWGGLVFDNNGGHTGATLDEMNNVGQLNNDITLVPQPGRPGFFDSVPVVGRSGDVLWGTDSGSFPDEFGTNLPPGAFFNFNSDPAHPGNPPANLAWQIWARPGYVMPEPGTAGLFGCAGLPLAAYLWRRRRG